LIQWFFQVIKVFERKIDERNSLVRGAHIFDHSCFKGTLIVKTVLTHVPFQIPAFGAELDATPLAF
jgi:hypothetical protein